MEEYYETEGACPLVDDPRLYLDIGAFSKVPQVEAIIDSKCVFPENTNTKIKIFLRHLQRPKTISDKEPLTLISLDAYREPW